MMSKRKKIKQQIYAGLSSYDGLAEICGAENLISRPELMLAYTTDWRQRYHGPALAIVFPENSQQIQQIIKLCQELKISIIPQGGNTSTCGAATPLSDYPRGQLILNLQRMNKIIALDAANSSLIVEAGCTLQQVQNYAREHNFYFPLCLASQGSCQIGGNLATNAGGVQVLKYGMMRDLCLGLEVVLPDQSILNQLHSLRKDNSYLDLKQLFIGSEGTLGVISKASLKLFPLPQQHCTLLLATSNLQEALQLLQYLRQNYLNSVSAFEIIKRDSQQIYQEHFSSAPLPLSANWLILCELEVSNDFNLDHFILRLTNSSLIDPENCLIASNQSEREELWQFRERIPLAEKKHGYAVKHDIALPLSQIENFLKLNMPKLLSLIPNGYFSIFGHLGDGNLHYNFGIQGCNCQLEISQLEAKISPLVYQDVITLGGSIAAEHGIGQSKKGWLKYFSQPENYALFCQLKKLLDPEELFNPGKIFA